MTSKRVDVLEDTQATILDLVHDLKENVFSSSDEQGDLMMVEFFFKRMHQERIMEHIIQQILPHKNKIKDRNIDFFLSNRVLFAGLPSDRVDYYSNIIATGSRLCSDDRDVIWQYFDTLLALAESYRKIK